MSRDLVLDVIAKKNSRDLNTLADEFDRLAKQTDDAGKRMHDMGTFSQFLDDQIAKTKVQVKELGEEFDKTGKTDVFANLRGAQSNLRSLERVKKDLVDAFAQGGEQAGTEFEKNFSASMQGAESTPVIGPIIVGGLVASIVAASPIIGGALNGALLAGIGLGGIGAGIVGQLHDPKIQAEFQGLGRELSQWLTDATVGFKQPLLDAGKIFAGAFDSIGPHLQKDISGLAQYVRPLADGIQRLFMNMQPGLDRAFAVAGPILKALAEELPGLGAALNRAFSVLSDNQQGATEGMRTIMGGLQQTIIIVGDMVGGLAKAYEWFVNIGDVASQLAADIFGWVPGLGDYFKRIHDFWDSVKNGPVGAGQGPATAISQIGQAAVVTDEQLSALNTTISQTKVTTDTLAGAMAGKIFNEMMSVDQATLAWHQSLTQLDDTLKQNGLAIDQHTHQIADNTAKGEANRSAILAAVTANMAQYQAQIAAGMSAQDAAKNYDDNTAALERQLRKAGLTQGAIDGLIGKYAAVPDEVNTEIALHGIEAAIDRLTDMVGLINDIPGYRQVTIDERHRISTDMGHNASGGSTLHGFATGGMIEVGEQGRELLAMPALSAPAYVTPNSTINGAANGVGVGQDLGTITVLVRNGDTGEEIISKIVTVGRRTNRKTFDTLIPVATSR